MRLLAIVLICVMAGNAWAFPDNGVLDTFTGADNTSPPNSNWTIATITGSGGGAARIRSNALTTGTANSEDDIYWNPTTFNADQEAYIDILDVSVLTYVTVWARLANIGSGTTDGYGVYTDDALSQVVIGRITNGSFVQLGAAISQTVSNNDKVGIRVTGDQICAWFYDASGAAVWTQLACRTDATYSAGGSIAVSVQATNNTTGVVDNFGGGNQGVVASVRRRPVIIY